MGLEAVGRGDQRHAMARMPRLGTPLLAALLAQALRLAPQTVTGRRLATIVAVFRQAALQFLHARQQRPNLLAQGGILNSQGGDFLDWRHATSLPALASPS